MIEYLNRLRERGIRVSVDEQKRIHLKPKGLVTADLVAWVRANKACLIETLNRPPPGRVWFMSSCGTLYDQGERDEPPAWAAAWGNLDGSGFWNWFEGRSANDAAYDPRKGETHARRGWRKKVAKAVNGAKREQCRRRPPAARRGSK